MNNLGEQLLKQTWKNQKSGLKQEKWLDKTL